MADKLYHARFYRNRDKKTRYAARTVIGLVREVLPEIGSAVDVGCGVGTWLNVIHKMGTEDILGLEGSWVDKALLQIPLEKFRETNLSDPTSLGRKFDLAISLEVAEHIDSAKADAFVEFLTDLSDFVLFGAALPGQGGVGHVNEQWPSYWAERFRKRGYVVLDILRGALWWDESIPYWYRQNTLLYVRQARMPSLNQEAILRMTGTPIAAIHPEHYESARLGKMRRALQSWLRNARGRT